MTQLPDATDAPDPQALPDDGEIIARPGRYYRNARFIMALICFGMGGWFAYDGIVKYPNQNIETRLANMENRKSPYKMHTETDITLQKRLGIGLPIIGLAVIGWTLRNSRGQYRFADNTLHVPGHPPVTLAEMTGVDKSKWKRKGILLVDYQPAGGGTPGRLKLDDFVYEQDPTDAIGKRILRAVGEDDDEDELAPADDDSGDSSPESAASGRDEMDERQA